jgi:ribosomal protein S18 acetylase RimI-like enzyme
MIRLLTQKDIPQVSKIHSQELHGFLPQLGTDFLEKFYGISLKVPSLFTYVEEKNGKIRGFVMGAESTKGLFLRIILKDVWGFSLLFSRFLVLHVFSFFKLIATLAYPGFSQDGPELLSIAVSNKYQGQGIGKVLFKKIEKEFQLRGFSEFKISVYDRLPSAGFYKKMGCRHTVRFSFLGENMSYFSFKV